MSNDLMVGVAEVDITPPVGTLLAGSLKPRTSKGVADPLYVKAVVLESGGKRMAYVILDLISVERDAGDAAVELASRETGIPAAHIVWAASHTHSGPYTRRRQADYVNKEWFDQLPQRFAECVKKADGAKTPARMSRARGYHNGLGHNRRLRFKDGREVNTWLLNKGEEDLQCVGAAAPIDPELGMLAFEDMEGRMLAVLFHYTLHTNAHFGIEFSADYPGIVSERMRDQFGPNVVTLFLPGACGDINRIGLTYREIGDALADVMVSKLEKRSPIEGPIPLGACKRYLTVPCRDAEMDQEERLKAAQWGEPNNDYFRNVQKQILEEGITRMDTVLQAWHIGDTSFLSLPGEVFVEWGLKIKQDSPFPWTYPVELGGDSLGYLVTRKAWEAGGYESLISWSLIDVAGVELMVDRGLEMLRQLHRSYEETA